MSAYTERYEKFRMAFEVCLKTLWNNYVESDRLADQSKGTGILLGMYWAIDVAEMLVGDEHKPILAEAKAEAWFLRALAWERTLEARKKTEASQAGSEQEG